MGQGAGKWLHNPLVDDSDEELQERIVPKQQLFSDTTVPYVALTKLKLIKQLGRTPKGDQVEWNSKDKQWVHTKCKSVVTQKEAANIRNHHDVQSGCVIRVVGDIDFSDFVTSVEKKRAIEKRKIFELLRKIPRITEGMQTTLLYGSVGEFRRQTTTEGKKSTGYEELLGNNSDEEADDEIDLNDQPPSIKNVEQYSEWCSNLKQHQIAKFIKQYLQRSIPNAAREMKSVIFVSDVVINTPNGVRTSDIARLLNKGMLTKEKLDADYSKKETTKCDPLFLPSASITAVHAWIEQDMDIPVQGEERAEPAHMPSIQQSMTEVTRQLSQYSNHVYLVDSETKPSTQRKSIEFTGTLMRTLLEGHEPNPELPPRNQAPYRKPCNGACYVLVGGDPDTCVLEIQQAAEQNCKVVVVEGSGGYADIICSTINRVKEIVGTNAADDFRNCLGAISPRTSRIIDSGCVHIARRGTTADEFQELIKKAMTYDDSLYSAWLKYALWDYNSQYCRQLFIYLQILVLFLGILATTLSILQTFLQLQYPEDTGVGSSSAKHSKSLVGQVYTWMGLVVVVLPVGLSLVEAIENKLNAGGRWVALRTASESLLREIYMYRAQVRSYSSQAVRASVQRNKQRNSKLPRDQKQRPATAPAPNISAVPAVTGSAAGGNEEQAEESVETCTNRKVQEELSRTDEITYKSRQEKLSSWTEMLINDVKDGQCANNTLEAYNGPLPPHHILEAFDDGWSDLSPDEYVCYRLIPLIKRYDRAAKYYEAQLSLFTVSNYVLGAIGTLLAALSSVPPLDTYNLQAWVALTTGISNAATRYMDYCRMDFLQKKSNKVKMALHDVQSWWDSRGNESESQAVKNDLVTRVEALITGEFVEWGGQMKKEMDKSKKDNNYEDAQEMARRLAGEEAMEQLTQIKELGLADISANNLLAALENPDGPERKKVFDSMTRLAGHIEQSTGFEAEKVLEHNLIKEVEKQAVALKNITNESLLDDVGQLLHKNLGGMAMGDFVPADLAAKLKTPKDRRRIFRSVEKLNPKVLSRQDCLGMLSQAGGMIADTVADLSQRQMLEILKEGAVEQLHEELIGGLKKFNICLYDLIPRDEMITELLLELKDVCKVDWRRMQSESILKLVKNSELKSRMSELNEVALRGLLKRSDKLFRQKSAQVLQSVMEKISKLDVEELFSTTQLRAEVFDTLEDLEQASGSKLAIWCLTKEDLLAKLPPAIQKLEHVVNKPQAQIVEYINTIKGGFSASRIFRAFRDEINENPPSKGGKDQDPLTHTTLMALYKNKRLTDRFAFAVKSITQLEVNRCDKKMLMRKLAMSPAFSSEMVDELKFLDGDSLKALMSCLKSYISNSYQGRVFDILCDEVSTFDLRNLLPDAEDREKFINQIREFKGVDIKQAPKKDLITTLAYQSLVLKFMKLSEEQIRELIERALTLMGNAFHNGIFVTSYVDEFKINPEDELQRWDEEMVDRLCLCLLRQPVDITEKMDNARGEASNILQNIGTQPKEVLETIETQMLAMLPDRMLHPMLPGWEADRQLRVFSNMRTLLGERVLANVFESAARELPPTLAIRFQLAFLDPRNRLSMLACFEELIQYPFDQLSSERTNLLGYMINGNIHKRRFLEALEAILTGSELTNTSCLQDLVLHLINEILISVPYRLFLMLCLRITRFDLREVLDDPQTRRLVAVVLLKCFQNNKKLRETAEHGGAKPHILTVDASPKEILDSCDNLYEYEMVANDLRMLSGPQMQRLVREVMSFFKETHIGRFFEKLLAKHQHDSEDHDSSHDDLSYDDDDDECRSSTSLGYNIVIESVTSIKGHLQLDPKRVKTEFRGFDAEQFFGGTTEEEKTIILQKYIPDDSAVRRIAQFSQIQYKRLFAHISALPWSRASNSCSDDKRESLDMRLYHERLQEERQKVNFVVYEKILLENPLTPSLDMNVCILI